MICVLLAIPLVTTAVNVRGVDEKLGWKVGEILRQTVTAAAADARHADGNQFQTALRSQLDEDSRVLVNPRVSELVSRANRILPETPERDAVCNRSWSVACPDGWKLVGNSCIAPRSYTGGCHRLVDTEGYTQLQKERFAHDCHAPWPCNDECSSGHDYDHDCPRDWVPMGSGLCKQRAFTPSEMCQTTYAFGNMDVLEKQILAENCGIEWPCLRTCSENYDGCPEGWTKLEEMCVAPPDYAGACDHLVNMSGMLAKQKKGFRLKCAAPFPCLGNISDQTETVVGVAASQPDGPVDVLAVPAS